MIKITVLSSTSENVESQYILSLSLSLSLSLTHTHTHSTINKQILINFDFEHFY
jgi:hypothetical protein